MKLKLGLWGMQTKRKLSGKLICISYPTDIQYPGAGDLEPIYPPSAAEKTTPEQVTAMAQEYLAMEREIADIQIVLNHIPAKGI